MYDARYIYFFGLTSTTHTPHPRAADNYDGVPGKYCILQNGLTKYAIMVCDITWNEIKS